MLLESVTILRRECNRIDWLNLGSKKQLQVPTSFSFKFQAIIPVSFYPKNQLQIPTSFSFKFQPVIQLSYYPKLVTGYDIIQLENSTYHSAFILSKNQLQVMTSFSSKIQTFIQLSYCPKIIHRLQNHLALIVAMQLDPTPCENWIYP